MCASGRLSSGPSVHHRGLKAFLWPSSSLERGHIDCHENPFREDPRALTSAELSIFIMIITAILYFLVGLGGGGGVVWGAVSCLVDYLQRTSEESCIHMASRRGLQDTLDGEDGKQGYSKSNLGLSPDPRRILCYDPSGAVQRREHLNAAAFPSKAPQYRSSIRAFGDLLHYSREIDQFQPQEIQTGGNCSRWSLLHASASLRDTRAQHLHWVGVVVSSTTRNLGGQMAMILISSWPNAVYMLLITSLGYQPHMLTRHGGRTIKRETQLS
ncbi:hypothetical protein F4809DRAFT_79504 [Biscogniauxia mediterranea]|nr:hypothetical protein F4809DRAFT_79504 [Biscogniauxia mediterranea]